MSAKLTIPIPDWLDKICAWPVLLCRKLKYGYTFRRIPLGEDLFASVDPQDFYWLNRYHWSPRRNNNRIYAIRFRNDPGKKTKIVSMHRLLMNPPPRLLVDHRNGDSLDNRRDNLRIATHSQNQFNKAKTRLKTSSSFVGTYLEKRSGLWPAKISHHGKSIWLGRFKSESAAAKAYDKAAKKYHGEFARLNFPDINAQNAEAAGKF
jgi:hypothetical protein